MAVPVLIVDDDPEIRELVGALLDGREYALTMAATGKEALRHCRDGFEGVLILDDMLPDYRGSQLFGELRALTPHSPVIFITGYGTTELAIQTIQGGAFEFIDKSDLMLRLAAAVANAVVAMENDRRASSDAFEAIITQSPLMLEMFRALRKAVKSNISVLVRGESGTGKELIARALHMSGPRHSGPFVAVNCAGIPNELLEAEMFGYEKGAFTGAAGRKLGRFDIARGGTLLLDEIGEMPAALQAKLLRVLQEGEYQRLGGTQTLKADVRIVSATNRNLEKEVEEGRFREDLYFRLAVFTVVLPPLRDRAEDIPLLVKHFAQRASDRENKRIDKIDDRLMDVLSSYRFPGNVRELENVLTFAVVASSSPILTISCLPQTFLGAVALTRSQKQPSQIDLPKPDSGGPFPTLADIERIHVQRAMELAKGNKAEAARLLGVSRMTLYRKLEDD